MTLDELLAACAKHNVASFDGEYTDGEAVLRANVRFHLVPQATNAPEVGKVLREASAADAFEKRMAQQFAHQQEAPDRKVPAIDAALDLVNNPAQLYPEGTSDE